MSSNIKGTVSILLTLTSHRLKHLSNIIAKWVVINGWTIAYYLTLKAVKEMAINNALSTRCYCCCWFSAFDVSSIVGLCRIIIDAPPVAHWCSVCVRVVQTLRAMGVRVWGLLFRSAESWAEGACARPKNERDRKHSMQIISRACLVCLLACLPKRATNVTLDS